MIEADQLMETKWFKQSGEDIEELGHKLQPMEMNNADFRTQLYKNLKTKYYWRYRVFLTYLYQEKCKIQNYTKILRGPSKGYMYIGKLHIF